MKKLMIIAAVVFIPVSFLALFNLIALPFYKLYPYTSKWHDKLFYLPSDHLVKNDKSGSH